jgi:hypothetical protein
MRGLGVRKLACALFRGSLLPRPIAMVGSTFNDAAGFSDQPLCELTKQVGRS